MLIVRNANKLVNMSAELSRPIGVGECQVKNIVCLTSATMHFGVLEI